MYESKKNTGRKDIYKYQKSSHQKNFHNSTHFGHHKYNKYKQKYNHSNSIKDYDEEKIFSQIFDENKASKKGDLKEIDDLTPTPTIKPCMTLKESKENFSLNSNINDLNTQMKTNDFIDISESNKIEINENISSFNNSSSCTNIPENFIINEKENEKKEQINYRINNININNENINININNFNKENININNLHFDTENVKNDLFLKDKEYFLASNEKENIHLEYKKNLYKTPQPFKANSSSSINLSSNAMKEAYYVPKKLSVIYDKYTTQQETTLFDRRRNSFNNFNFMAIQKPTMSLSNKQIPNNNNLGILNNINLNYFKNNKNNNFLHFNNGNNNINLSNNNFNIPNSPNLPMGSFNLFECNNIGSINNINNLPNLQQCFNYNNNSNHNMSKNPFNNMMPQFELNKCILKTQISNNNLFEKDKENTDILEINVKVSEEENLIFKIRRYDDMFKTVKMFCEINKLDIKLIRPLIIHIIRALNSIYGIYNLSLKSDEIKFLKEIKKNFFNNEEENNNIVEDRINAVKSINNGGNANNVEDKGSLFNNSKENCDEEGDSSSITEE